MDWPRKGPGSQIHLSSSLALVCLMGESYVAPGAVGAADRGSVLRQVKQLICPAGVPRPGGKSSAEANLKWETGRLL